MGADQFYTSNNLEKYPEDGKLPQCKKCITMHVDNWNPDTYMWILQECDVPYIPDEWNKLMNTYAKDRKKVTGTTIIGRYLSKMKLKQWRDYRWKDTEFLQDMANKKIEETNDILNNVYRNNRYNINNPFCPANSQSNDFFNNMNKIYRSQPLMHQRLYRLRA